jgi:hypothetical protein
MAKKRGIVQVPQFSNVQFSTGNVKNQNKDS